MATKRRKSFLIVALCAAVVIAVTLVMSLPRRTRLMYHVTFLPTLGGFRTDPHSINDRGQIVGVADTPTGSSFVFLWDKERGFRTIERFDDPAHGGGLCINNAGQITGTAADPNGNQRGYLWDPNTGRQWMGALGGKQSSAEGLNNRGQVIGTAEVPARHRHAFVWDATRGMTDLGTFGGPTSAAMSINDAGQIAGYAETVNRHFRIVIWDPVTSADANAPAAPTTSAPSRDIVPSGPPGYNMIDLGDAGVGPYLCEINNVGLAVRRLAETTGKTRFKTWTKDAGMKTLDFVIDSGLSIGLNDRNQFIIRGTPTGLRLFGRVFARRHHCYLWDPNSGPLLLESHLPVRDIVHLGIKDVNNRGQLVGTLRTEDSTQIRAVLLEKDDGQNAGN